MSTRKGAYGADSDIVDYILGITYEIWEQREVELIHQYYAKDAIVYGLDGITHGAAEVVRGTYDTLRAFPDRRLMAENVTWSGNRADGFYTSHRLLSVMTNEGTTQFGPPTGNRVRMINIADCVIENGVIVEEWLARDNMALVTQLGSDPIVAARELTQHRGAELVRWIESETGRVRGTAIPESAFSPLTPRQDPTAFAWRALTGCWRGERDVFDSTHAPYCVLHRSPLRQFSGREEVFGYYQSVRRVLGNVHFSVDHVASQPYSGNGVDLAVRWSVSGSHEGTIHDVVPTGKPLFIMGVTHWRCIADRIAIETTIFDDLAVLSQTMAE